MPLRLATRHLWGQRGYDCKLGGIRYCSTNLRIVEEVKIEERCHCPVANNKATHVN
jgi:hypothetical protein